MFIKSETTYPLKTLFLIGNGAIENGSTPLKKAQLKAKEENFFSFNPDLLGEAAALSCLSLFEREMFDLLILHLKGAHPHLPNSGDGLSGFQLCLGRLYAYWVKLCRKILANSYLDHSLSFQSYCLATFARIRYL